MLPYLDFHTQSYFAVNNLFHGLEVLLGSAFREQARHGQVTKAKGKVARLEIQAAH